MLAKVQNFIDRYQLIGRGDQLVVACSGGSDSVALFYLLLSLRERYGCTLVLAHVNHELRGADAAADEVFVQKLSEQFSVPYVVKHYDVGRLAVRRGLSVEEAGRIVRYHFFQQVAATLVQGKIVTAHHQDDQAETVLMNLLRGSGSDGLKGILPCNGNIIRPLLAVSKQEILQYLTKQNVSACFDKTNEDPKFLRNRIRLCLLPHLQVEYNNHIKESLCRTAMILQDEHDFLRQTALALYPQVVQPVNHSLYISQKIVDFHPALRREVLRLAIQKKQGTLRGIGFLHVEQLTEMFFSRSVGAELKLPQGLLAYKHYDAVELTHQPHSNVMRREAETVRLVLPGKTILPQRVGTIEARITSKCEKAASEAGACFDYDALSLPLFMRFRRDGDRFAPLGLGGSQKVKKYLIDHKVPREQRDFVPIVYNSQGILWLGGLRQSAIAAVSDQTTHYLSLIFQED